MVPSDLQPAQFGNYPPEARKIAEAEIVLLRQLPLGFLPLLLRELIAYDWKFPAERRELDNQFAYLDRLSPDELKKTMAPFAGLRLSPALEAVDWVNLPAQFSEQLTAHLWATHQIDAFRTASVAYIHTLNTAYPPEPVRMQRLAIVLIGDGVSTNNYRLFRKLRPEGVYFPNVDPTNGRKILLDAVIARKQAHPEAFAHWYIDGSTARPVPEGITCVSFSALDSIRIALVNKMREVMQPGGGGPEVLRTMLAQMRPEELGLAGSGHAAVLNRFQVSILTEGSGTQIFSTTFVQWAAREALRRAQPLTLFARFAPRLHEQSMRELLAGSPEKPLPDPHGSLIDGDMGAYYTWINQQRLSGADRSTFLVWFENHNEALAIGPALARGTEDKTATNLSGLLQKLG